MDPVPPASRDPAEAFAQPDRSTGLTLEGCYRHPEVLTGVHCTRCGRAICPDCMHEAPVGYQCPDCVRAARRSGPRRGPLVVGGGGSVTSALLVINIAVFVVQMLGGGAAVLAGSDAFRLFELGALQPLAVARGQYWRLFTAMFLHAGLLHIALNMYGLYLFGGLVERALGRVRFLAVYLVSGFLASVASFTFSDPRSFGVGASGAIFGLLGAWVAFNLRRRGTAFASANLRWAFMLIAINLVLGFSLVTVDNFAHLGGLGAGFVAGGLAEGIGPRRLRPALQVAGFVALVGVGVVVTALRSAALA